MPNRRSRRIAVVMCRLNPCDGIGCSRRPCFGLVREWSFSPCKPPSRPALRPPEQADDDDGYGRKRQTTEKLLRLGGKVVQKVPYDYVTESGEKYHVDAVSWKGSIKVETGVIRFSNGDRYDGDWAQGAKNGKGIYTCGNGVCYDGRWKDDMRHGVGTCKYGNGDVYSGKWNRNQKHGEGTYAFHNGCVPQPLHAKRTCAACFCQ
eukprot:699210-Rhodomonas_salina.3